LIKLFNSTGAPIGQRRLRQAKALVRTRQAEWIEDGVSIRLRHKTDAEVIESMSRSGYDTCQHPAHWRVIQPASCGFRTLCAQLVMPR
jgi:hypothetical protein